MNIITIILIASLALNCGLLFVIVSLLDKLEKERIKSIEWQRLYYGLTREGDRKG